MKFIIKKLITLIITLLLISLLSFTAFSVIPGDASVTRLGKDASPEQIEVMREKMGLNAPLPIQYGRWISGVAQGNFGESYRYEGTTVSSLLSDRLPVTVLLAVIAFIIILGISVPLGIISARFSGKWVDIVINHLSQVVMAAPSFFLGMILTYIFGLTLHFFQPGKFVLPTENLTESAKYLFYPALAVALPKIAMVIKFLRNSVLSELHKDYVRTAYSKGNSENRVLYVHVFKNALIPVITFLAMVIVEILAGSIIVEQVFSVPGIGRLLISSISNRDYPVVQAIVLYITAIVVIINFIVDILYQFLDPRVRAY